MLRTWPLRPLASPTGATSAANLPPLPRPRVRLPGWRYPQATRTCVKSGPTRGAQDRENTRLSPAIASAMEDLHADVHDDAHGMSEVAARRQTRCGVFQC